MLDAEVGAGEIGAQDRFPIVRLHAHGQAVAGDGGVVDQDVETAEALEELLEPYFDLFDVGDVHFDGECFVAFGDEFANKRVQFFFGAGGDGYLGPGLREGQGSIATNAVGGSGD